MPFTPYHFGPSAFIGLAFRKWIDIPVFILANVVVDLEVLVILLLKIGLPVHRYVHTLLIGAAVGLLWAVIAYPLRGLFKKIMQIFRLPYETSLAKMAVSGVLGVWLHVLLDATCNWDVRLFWPSKAVPLYSLLTLRQTEAICLAFFAAAVILYAIVVASSSKQTKADRTTSNTD